MKLLIVIGLLFYVEISYQRSIIRPRIPEESDKSNGDFVKKMDKFDNKIVKERNFGENPKNEIEEYLHFRKFLKSRTERRPRKVEIPEIQIPEIKIPDIEIPDIKIPEITIPDIPETKFDDIDFSWSKKTKKDKREIKSDAFDENVDKMIYKVIDKRPVDSKFKNSFQKIIKNDQSLNRFERGSNKSEIIEVEGDPNELIDKVMEKYSDKDIRIFHVKSIEQLPDSVAEYGGDIYIDKSFPKVSQDLFVMVIL
uniref:Uncharacterized protein n=1 Tax=Panagrolaimus davidi TaxID=227884 RepID=A0A914PSP8_9BILA